jgi:hypothetical protein
MSRTRSITTALPLALLFPLASLTSACGGTTVSDNGKDSGAPDSGPREDAGPGRDAALDTGPSADASRKDAAVSDAATGPTLLAPGKDYVLWGVTSDGYAVYTTASDSSSTLYAVSIAGGSPMLIDTLSSEYSEAIVVGPLVIVLNDVTTTTGLGTIATWTSSIGFHTISTKAYVYEFDPSSDNQSIVYMDNFDSTAQTADARVTKIDGTGNTLLEAAVPGMSYTSMCFPEVLFAGTSSVVLSYCTPPSTTTGSIYSFSAPSWSMTTIATGTYPYVSPDPTGTNLLLYNGGLQVVPVTGGTPTTIDPTGQNGVFTSDGANLVYVSAAGALLRSPVTAPAPTVLVAAPPDAGDASPPPGGLEGILALSPDNSTALVFKQYDQMTYLSDLYSASAATPGPLTTLNSTQTNAIGGGEIVYGSAFTGDSSHVIFYTSVSTAAYPYVGTLESSPAVSSATTMLGQNTNTAFASGKTKVVFEDNFALLAGSAIGTADVEWVDTQAGGSPALVVSKANAGSYYGSFFLSADGSQIVYAMNETGTTKAGVYVTPVP